MGSDVAEAQVDDLSDAKIDVLLEIYEPFFRTDRGSPHPGGCFSFSR
jgi:hypothetical protein